jgi:magnesium-transporting ATPase (P-type)
LQVLNSRKPYILFSDKTGTITKGKLEVVTFVDGYEQSLRLMKRFRGK